VQRYSAGMGLDTEHEFCSSLYGELQSAGCCGRYVEASHKALERNIGHIPANARLLELGGNIGEHCRFVTHSYSEYLVTDYRSVDFKPMNDRVRFEVADAEELPYPESSFDRVLVTCVLHHLPNPELALREMRRVVRPGGLISLTLPCDPGLLYRVGKAVGPYRSLKRRGFDQDPRVFHYSQHRNHYPGLNAHIRDIFSTDDIQRRSWPFLVPTWNMNLFSIFQIRKGL
jgi:phosphatidylethanolamine/phosphatidyl-N-methylethanolamine N-methyltransferase